MTKWLDKLEGTRSFLTELQREDGEPDPTDEDVLAQTIHDAISDYLEEEYDPDDDDWESHLAEWVDR